MPRHRSRQGTQPSGWVVYRRRHIRFADPEASQVVQALGAEPVFGSTRDFAAAVEDEQKFLDGLIRQFPLN